MYLQPEILDTCKCVGFCFMKILLSSDWLYLMLKTPKPKNYIFNLLILLGVDTTVFVIWVFHILLSQTNKGKVTNSCGPFDLLLRCVNKPFFRRDTIELNNSLTFPVVFLSYVSTRVRCHTNRRHFRSVHWSVPPSQGFPVSFPHHNEREISPTFHIWSL